MPDRRRVFTRITALGVLSGVALSGVAPTAATADPGARSATSAAGGAGSDQAGSPESLAVAEARRSNKDVVVPSLRTETSDVSAKPDGTLLATIHTKPVRTRKDGSWKDIDTTLRSTPSGALAPGATLTDLEFSGGGDRPLVRIGRAGKELTLSWPRPLPRPVVDGATAVYPSILPDIDLRMTATEGGFTQFFVVKTPEAAKNPQLNQLTLGMSAKGLTMRRNADGSVAAVDTAGGGTVFEAPKPVMFDSSGGLPQGTALPPVPDHVSGTQPEAARAGKALSAPSGRQSVLVADGAAHAAPVGLTIADDQKSLALTPDRALLDAPGTVYPVLIDPNLDTPKAGAWAGISRAWPGNSYYKFGGDFGTGYCIDAACASNDLKRVLYAIPVKGRSFVGKNILSAKLNVWETHSFSCTKKPLQLYATGRIGTGTNWSNSSSPAFWSQHLQTIQAARGHTNCASGYVEFGGSTSKTLRDKFQQAANGDWVDVTLGLKAENESDGYAWKRFSGTASVQIGYNLPPKQPQMKDLTMSPGSVCSSSTLPITKHPQVTARVFDPDGDKLGVQFAAAWSDSAGVFKRRWWSTGAEGTAPSSGTFKASGSLFSVTLPAAVPKETTVGWEARAWDGSEWSPWSSTGTAPTDCYFRIDTSAPAGPVVTSSAFPGSTDAQAELPWTDGVGKYGTFSFDTASADAVKYQYGLDQSPSSAREVATTGGAARSVNLLMTTDGPHFLSVRALDAAGNASENTTYYFNVLNGQPQRAGWSMDADAGATALPGEGGNHPATLAGTAVSGVPAVRGEGVTLSGALAADKTPTDHLSTTGAVLETDKSFTVSAWVNAAEVAGNSASAVSQSGRVQHAFGLGLHTGKWTLQMPSADAVAIPTWAMATSATAPVAGEWTHLTGVYNAQAKTATLYVNGVAGTPVTAVTAWSARGSLEIGRLKYRSAYTDAWKGSLDDIRVWDRVLSPAEVTAAKDGAAVTGPGAKAVWSLDGTGPEMAGRSEAGAAVPTGTVETGVPGVSGKAVRFGANGYADVKGPQVDGTRSFAVSSWVKLPAIAAGDTVPRMAVGQTGAQNNEFSLYYSAADKKWKFGRYKADTADAQLVTTWQPACTAGTKVNGAPCFSTPNNEWTHLVGVSDSAAQKIRLYINGYLVSETAYTQTTPWNGKGNLRIGAVGRAGGASEFFTGGTVDDVRLFDRVLTGPEIQDMVQQRPQLVGRWKFNQAPGNVTPGEPAGAAAATLYGQAAINPGGGVTGTGSLTLNGTTGYAATATTPLRTDESFSLAGWAQTAGSPERDMTVLSVAGANESALTVGWKFNKIVDGQATGWWQATVATADGASATHTSVIHTYDASLFLENWNHLAVVYDGFSDQLTLYVNGNLENQLCPDDGSAPGCTDHVSWAGAPSAFVAAGGIQFGRTRTGGQWKNHLSGEVDDMWAYQGVLSHAQVIMLSGLGDELDTKSPGL
ncbi:LamG domain-containing protein [Streptomyces erythrochromogenes]|uniref:LamG domain-containing protein n=1 Tax=Streptomyces erythrochromogenes TaxID=285574 RepID=UPI0038249735|nr:LamG domain-containing protein [Streptomyces erythrochromogenes]